ncbi:MAG: DUF3426 domain-containing protein [Woeseiaceae bacterium]
MYTQCPECDVAFRVTADVLKQAAGKVRCGGCGIAFNALAHLSEEMPGGPEVDSPPVESEPVASDQPAELEAGTPPQAISAEQSAALLKTLDQLAGEDIRIEDTGVEWRVMDVDEDDLDKELADDPVPSVAHEEMRFDDNTPLPEDFDLDAPAPAPPPVDDSEPEPEPETDPEESQVDLVFGEPDEWEDLLGDLDEAVEAAETSDPLDVDTQFALQAEALGLDLSVPHESQEEDENSAETAEDAEEELFVEFEEDVEEPEEEPEEETEEESEAESEQDTEDLNETSIEEDLIAAAFEVEAAAREAEEADEEEEEEYAEREEINLDDVDPEDLTRAGILDEDDYLEVITEDVEEDEILDEIQLEDSPQDQLLTQEVMDDEAALEAAVEALEEGEPAEDESLEEPQEEEVAEEEVAEEEILEEEWAEEDPEEELLKEELLEAEFPEEVLQDEESLDEELEELESESVEYAEPVDADVPEPTEEEKTVNMMIDEELLAIAVEDEDGFTSTIVQKQVTGEAEIPPEAAANDDEEFADPTDEEDEVAETENAANAVAAIEFPADDDDNPLMETIIMEGETVLNEQDEERLAAARAAASESLKKAGFDVEKSSFRDWRPPKHSMAAAAALLAVVLVIQVIHYSREALAVSPAFQNTIGPVYRMVGSPVTPAWDVKGWRFEATKGSTNEAGDVLTIYSRIGNNSEQTLPYPLVHVSLTDRFEEIIGSRVLEPSDYLIDNADPSIAIEPRESFDAVIAIEAPSAAATSFKLNVCYRLASGQLRCADKDFR